MPVNEVEYVNHSSSAFVVMPYTAERLERAPNSATTTSARRSASARSRPLQPHRLPDDTRDMVRSRQTEPAPTPQIAEAEVADRSAAGTTRPVRVERSGACAHSTMRPRLGRDGAIAAGSGGTGLPRMRPSPSPSARRAARCVVEHSAPGRSRRPPHRRRTARTLGAPLPRPQMQGPRWGPRPTARGRRGAWPRHSTTGLPERRMEAGDSGSRRGNTAPAAAATPSSSAPATTSQGCRLPSAPTTGPGALAVVLKASFSAPSCAPGQHACDRGVRS